MKKFIELPVINIGFFLFGMVLCVIFKHYEFIYLCDGDLYYKNLIQLNTFLLEEMDNYINIVKEYRIYESLRSEAYARPEPNSEIITYCERKFGKIS